MPTHALGWQAKLEGVWSRLAHARGPELLVVVVAVNLVATLYVQVAVLQDYPNSGDEYAYLISAELISRGRLSVPSPEPREFFDVVHVVNDGKFYGKYPPGWPAILAPGVFLGVPWLVNPLLGALVTVLVYVSGRRHFGPEVANLSLLTLLANPFLLFNSASYFAHPACLLFLTACLHFALRFADDPRHVVSCLAMGASAGLAFVIRPFTAVALILPAAAWLTLRGLKAYGVRAVIRGVALAAVPFAACFAVFLLYNHAQTGGLFVQPFEKYAPWDVPSLPHDRHEWVGRLLSHVVYRLWDLARWLPLSSLFLGLFLFGRGRNQDGRKGVLLACVAGLFAAYFFYWGDGIVQYGPRYLYEALGAVVLISAAVIAGYGRGAPLLVVAVIGMNLGLLVQAGRSTSQEIAEKREVFERVEELGLSDALVFLGSGSGAAPAWDLARNGLEFDAPVLYVRDLGPRNRALLRARPGRKPYYYEYDPVRRAGRVIPFEPMLIER